MMYFRLKYPQPDAWLDLWGGTSGTFAGIDLFGRVTDQLWQNNVSTTPVAVDRYKYGYDRNSNRQYRANKVGTTPVGVTPARELDEYYTYDNLNRLTVMQRGRLTGSPPTGISGTPVGEQDWTLDPTGNWNGFVVKAAGSTTLNQSRTQNKVNEIVTIGASTGTDWADPVYDAAGNMTSMPKPSSLASSYTATYDAWNRMIQVKDGGTTVATYSYDGRNRRITVDTGVVRHFYFTNSWQDVEQRLGSLTTADQQYVWGIRYIDELVCRDRLVGSGSSSSSSSSGGSGLNERLYACQDANFNVTSLIDTSANVAERYTYDPCGTPTFRNVSWTDIGASVKASTILFAGYKYDAETGLYYVRNRYHGAHLGNWIMRDPIKYLGGMNLYQYVRGQLNNAVDPLGYVVGAAAGAAGAGITLTEVLEGIGVVLAPEIVIPALIAAAVVGGGGAAIANNPDEAAELLSRLPANASDDWPVQASKADQDLLRRMGETERMLADAEAARKERQARSKADPTYRDRCNRRNTKRECERHRKLCYESSFAGWSDDFQNDVCGLCYSQCLQTGTWSSKRKGTAHGTIRCDYWNGGKPW